MDRLFEWAGDINWDKFGAIIAWIGSYATTALTCIAVAKSMGQVDYVRDGMLAGLVLEIFLTIAKGKKDQVGYAAMIFDTLINAGGLWAPILKFDATPVWTMVSSTFSVDKTLRAIPGLILSIVFGYLLSIAPKKLWNR